MNCMSDFWSVFGVNQGQMVEIAYRYDADRDTIIRRASDKSDGSVRFDEAPCPEDVEWNGSESVPPFGDLPWSASHDPFAD